MKDVALWLNTAGLFLGFVGSILIAIGSPPGFGSAQVVYGSPPPRVEAILRLCWPVGCGCLSLGFLLLLIGLWVGR